MKYDNALQALGLSPNEAKCYQSLLRLGSASANEVSRESGIHRVSVYDALRGLREKGLVSQITKGNTLLFEAQNPEKLNSIAEEQMQEIVAAQSIVPNLLVQFQTAEERQEIHSYKGIVGVKSILKEMLSAKEILDFGAEYRINEYMASYFPIWDKERVKKKIRMRFIANEKIRHVRLEMAEFRYIPSEFASHVSTYIFDGRVAMIMWVDEPMGIIIEHNMVYESYRNYFEYLWKTAKI